MGDGRLSLLIQKSRAELWGWEEQRHSPPPLTPPCSPNPIPSIVHSLGGWVEPGPARWVPSNDTHYAGVWQLRGRRGPQGLRSHGTQPAHPRPFLILYESGGHGRQAGWGRGAGTGPAGAWRKEGKLRSLGAKGWYGGRGCWGACGGGGVGSGGGGGVCVCVCVCTHTRAGVYRGTANLA